MQDMVLMEELKEKDELGNNEMESAVVSDERVAGESEAVVESMDYEGEEGGSCNGDDIMVEVLGSHVYVDGICTTEGGGGFGGDANDKAARGNEGSVNPEIGNRDQGENDEKVSREKEQVREESDAGDGTVKSSDVEAAAEGETIKEVPGYENKDSASLSKKTESGGDLVENKVNQNNEPEDEHNSKSEVHDKKSPDRREVSKDENQSNRSKEGQEMEVEELDPDSEDAGNVEDNIAPDISGKVQQAKYELPMEDDGEFSVSDLVWGKVRSHPWWPGQIFDPSDASEKAMKHHKKDRLLVAYFGDRTFAWNEASVLKPFHKHFSHIEKQSNSEAFQNAVDCALEEVSRRVELGLICSCVPKDVYKKIRFQTVENAGIEDGFKDVGDRSLSFYSFETNKFLAYIKLLAESPLVGADQLDLAIAKAQLLAFYRLRGSLKLPELQECGAVLESDSVLEENLQSGEPMDGDREKVSQPQRTSYLKRKHNLKDIMYPSKKERSDAFNSLDYENDSDGKANGKVASSSSSKKRKAADSLTEEGKKTSSPKPSSFKIGECIRRAASQLAGSPSIIKSNDFPGDGYDVPHEDSERINPLEYSPDELLTQLQLAACDPLAEYSFSNIVISFFTDFRNSAVQDRLPVDTKKFSTTIVGSETFEFEDMNDTYWTDRIVQNGSEEQPSHTGQYQIVPVDLGKPAQKARRGRKRYSDGVNHDLATAKPPGYISENAPAEVVMSFPYANSVPVETKLNKMFRHFGPLKESETEVDRETSRARVVFKKCSDAEVAINSAGKFNIFGSVPVNYQLNYVISESFKASLYAPTLAKETHFFETTQGEHTQLISSSAGEGSHLISPNFVDDEPYVVSVAHLGEESLSMPAPLTEETLHLATSLGDEAMASFSTFGENFPVETSFYEASHPAVSTSGMETLAVPASTYEETSTVVTTICEDSKIGVASTIHEDYSTAPENVTKEFPTDTTMEDGAANVSSTACEETSTAAQTVGVELSTDAMAIDEGNLSVATNSDREIPVSATLDEENMAVAPTTGDAASMVATVADTTSAGPTALGEESVNSAAATVGEGASDVGGAAFDEDTPDVSAAVKEESGVVTSLVEESPNSFPASVEETSNVGTTLDEKTPYSVLAAVEETSNVGTTLDEETSTVVTTVREETVTTTSVEEETTVVTTVREETSSIATTLIEEDEKDVNALAETVSATLDQEAATIATSPAIETETTAKASVVETETVAPTLPEEIMADASTSPHNDTETVPTASGAETETKTVAPALPDDIAADAATSPRNDTETVPTASGVETETVAPTLPEEIMADASTSPHNDTETVPTASGVETETKTVAPALPEEILADAATSPHNDTETVPTASVVETETKTVAPALPEETVTEAASSPPNKTETVAPALPEETVTEAASSPPNETETVAPALPEETVTEDASSPPNETETVAPALPEETVTDAATSPPNNTETVAPALPEETVTDAATSPPNNAETVAPALPEETVTEAATSPPNETETTATASGVETETVAPTLPEETMAEADTADAPSTLGEDAPTDVTASDKESPAAATAADEETPTVVEKEKQRPSDSPDTETSPTDKKPSEETSS